MEEMERIFANADYGMDYRAVSQAAATLGSAGNAKESDVEPPWVQRLKDRRRQKAGNKEECDTDQSKQE